MKSIITKTSAVLFALLTSFMDSVTAQINLNEVDSSLVISRYAKMPKHLTDNQDAYPVKITLPNLFKEATSGRPALVVFWGNKRVDQPTLVNMLQLERLRKQLQMQADIYFAYIGKPENFGKDIEKLKSFAAKNDSIIRYTGAPFYIVEGSDNAQMPSEIQRLFSIDAWVLEYAYPLPVLVDAELKRTWQTDITKESLTGNLNLLLSDKVKERKEWIKPGNYQPIASAAALQGLLRKSFLDAEDFLKAQGYFFGGFYTDNASIFKANEGISYIRFDCTLDDKQFPDIILGIDKYQQVKYAAFTARPETMKTIVDELQKSGYVRAYPSRKDEDNQYYWSHPQKEDRFFADGIQFLGKYANPLLIEVALKEVAHRWDKAIRK